MRVPWPITVVSVIVTLGLGMIAVIIPQLQNVTTDAAPTWIEFIAGNALRVAVPALVVGAVAWVIERNIHRARRADAPQHGFDVVPHDRNEPDAASPADAADRSRG